ncbi:hypothetical protein [Prevotella multiformis]|nr:hypothetical protein [Prevotella multiformis]
MNLIVIVSKRRSAFVSGYGYILVAGANTADYVHAKVWMARSIEDVRTDNGTI